MDQKNTRIFALPNVEKLGQNICKKLDIDLSEINYTTFADNERILQPKVSVRNKHTYVIASPSWPVNDNLVDLLLFVDALKRSSAKTITVILTYYCYSRQDRKAAGRQPIGAKLIADLLTTSGITKIITFDLHNPSIQGFFNIPVDDLKAHYLFAKYLKETASKFTVVSPDHGGTVRARLLAELLSKSIQIAIVDKRRVGINKSVTMGILGDVKNKNVVIIDDMIDTGGTIIKAAKSLKNHGSKKIIVAATHGIFSKGFKHFDESKDIDQVWVADTIPNVHNIKSPKLKIISIVNLVSQSILATANGESISSYYKKLKKDFIK